jgi:two-component system chemotaxis sensor kinase CheA
VRSERFLDLYVSETREHLRLLVRSILRIESGEAVAVEEAFRAAHTIKGLAAAMGHHAAAAVAHRLEDRLARVRAGDVALDGKLGDELFAGTDELEAAITSGLRGSGGAPSAPASSRGGAPIADAGTPAGATSGTPGHAPATPSMEVPPGTVKVAHVRLEPGTDLPEARAMLIERSVLPLPGVTGADLSGAGRGDVLVYLDDHADWSAVERAIRGAGSVADILPKEPRRWSRLPGAAPALAETQAQPGVADSAVMSSVRVDRARLDEIAEGIAELSVLHARAAESLTSYGHDRAATVLAALQRTVLELRMVPVSTAFERLARVVRDAARGVGKDVDFELGGGENELDQSVLDALVDPLVHLLRNAVDHGIETPAEREAAGKQRRGSVRLETERERTTVRIVVRDDGRGVPRERVIERARAAGLLGDANDPTDDDLFRLLTHPGFSTAANVTELSGRGVGLDVVAARVRSLGGAIEMITSPGEGTTFTLRVPVTLALTHALRVRVGGEDYALPLTNVSEVVTLDGTTPQGRSAVHVRGDTVPLVDLAAVLGAPARDASAAVVAELGERRVALAVERVVGHEQILVKSFDVPVGTLPVFSGATLLPDGRAALLIDPLSVL